MVIKRTIGIIGGGNMGAAITGGIHKKYTVLVSETDQKKAQGLKRRYHVKLVTLENLAFNADIIILAIKPQDFESVLPEIRNSLVPSQIIISIAAGITTLYIEKVLGRVRVVRAMPNLALQIGEGMTALCKGKYAHGADVTAASRIFDCLGKVVVIEEKWMNAVTAVSGSGPAYVFLFAEMLYKAARSL